MEADQITFRTPQTEQEWDDYYQLRWEILRKPWDQPEGSEKDELESQSHHIAGFDQANRIIAVGRLHLNSPEQAQIRYMAINPVHQRQGLGRRLLAELEKIAMSRNARTIQLNARNHALNFYINNGYKKLADGHTLFNVIRHSILYKNL